MHATGIALSTRDYRSLAFEARQLIFSITPKIRQLLSRSKRICLIQMAIFQFRAGKNFLPKRLEIKATKKALEFSTQDAKRNRLPS